MPRENLTVSILSFALPSLHCLNNTLLQSKVTWMLIENRRLSGTRRYRSPILWQNRILRLCHPICNVSLFPNIQIKSSTYFVLTPRIRRRPESGCGRLGRPLNPLRVDRAQGKATKFFLQQINFDAREYVSIEDRRG